MNSLVHDQGFLGTRASLGADLTLLIIVAAFVLLTVGVVLARRRRYGAHRWVQTAAVVLNLIPVAAWMLRSLFVNLLPGLPGDLGQGKVALVVVHAVIGAIGAVLGVVIVIRANQLEAQGRSLAAYKTPMRIAYLVYLAAVVLGVVAYFVTYG